MHPRARSSAWDGVGVGVGDGARLWPEELSPGPWSVARWQHPIITVLGHIIILTRAPIMLLRQQAITLQVTAPHPAEGRLPIACNATNPTIRGQEPISAQMVTATLAPKPSAEPRLYIMGVGAECRAWPLPILSRACLNAAGEASPRRLANQVLLARHAPAACSIALSIFRI
jgi:hypothetical protein